jgi:hypothetical protein
MANIETITEYRFTKPNGKKVNVRMTFDNNSHIVESRYDDDELPNGVMSGEWWINALETKPYDKMNKPQRAIYDFLKVRLQNAN